MYDYTHYVEDHFLDSDTMTVKDCVRRCSKTMEGIQATVDLQYAHVLDVGGGNGALTIALITAGAKSITYLDVSKESAILAEKTCNRLLSYSELCKVSFLVGDLTQSSYAVMTSKRSHFGLVTCIGVWEHLTPEQSQRLLSRIRLMGNRVIIETAPNRILTDILRWGARLIGVSGGYKDQGIHVNEPTWWSLCRELPRDFKIACVNYRGWLYREARQALAQRKSAKYVLPFVWCVSCAFDVLSCIPFVRRMFCHGFRAVK